MPPLVGAFLAALLAAIGNAIFTYGNKTARAEDSPFGFVLLTFLISAAAMAALMAFQPPRDPVAFTKVNMGPALWAGIGTAITYVGFYILYSKFGASFYALYGMLAMLTTSIFLAIVILKERFNWSIGVSIGLAGVALGFFLYGQLMNQRASEALRAPTALASEPRA